MNIKDIKLIISDMDGTFLKEDSDNSNDIPLYQNMIKYIKDTKLAFASGRNLYSMISKSKIIGIYDYLDYIVSDNGALIYDIKEDELIYKNIIDSNLAYEIYNFVDNMNYDIAISVYTWDKMYLFGEIFLSNKEVPKTYATLVNVKDIASLPTTDIAKIVLFVKPQDQDIVFNEINKKYSDEIEAMPSETFLVELTNKGVTKGSALRSLKSYNGIDVSEMISFGNALNDIDMIKTTKYGIAVANAMNEVKEVADYITDDDSNNNAVINTIIKIYKESNYE